MYLAHFGLSETPFNITPDPRYLFMSDRHREAMAHLTFGVTQGGGFVQLTGEVGTGKTTICRCLLGQVPDDVEIALITNPKINELELLASICDELRIAYPRNPSSKVLVDCLNERLLDSHARGRRTVLIIDEAQNLSREVLERVRLLTNLETARQKLLQIILIGQPELTETLARPDLRQLAQRITARYHLAPLRRRDVADYVTHRLAVAGCHRPVFTRSAIRELFKETGGIPRLVNVVCDRALLGAYARNRHHVDGRMIKRASTELRSRRIGAKSHWQLPRLSGMTASLAMMLVGAALAWFFMRPAGNADALSFGERISQWRQQVANVVAPNDADRTTMNASTAGTSATQAPGSQALAPTAQARAPGAQAMAPGAQAVAPGAQAVAPVTGVAESAPAAEGQPFAPAQVTSVAASLNRQGNGQPTAVAEPTVVPEPATLGPPLAEILAANDNESKLEPAFRRLVMIWGEAFENGEDSVCERAQKINLKCLNAKGDWASLRRFDRPALLGLTTTTDGVEGTRRRYVVLRQLTQSTARVVVNDQEFVYPRSEIEAHWTGDFVILWRPPTSSTFLIRGASGQDVLWLREAMDTSFPNLAQGEVADAETFDGELEQLVIQFQEQNALSERGSVGAETLIALNSKLESGMPRLDGSSGGRRL